MTTLAASGPNAEQFQYWNEAGGEKWVALHRLIDAQIAPLGRATMDRAGIAAGERVLDVACGCGETTLEIAQRVGPAGTVLGVDISAVMLDRARQIARESGVQQVRFEQADAQTHALPAQAFDVLFSRFGVMFFADPDAAFRNLRSALRPGGRLAFVCWQSLPENPWMFVPIMALAQHIQLPPPPAPDAPGPFSFADAQRVRGILSRAGFADVALEELRTTLNVGGGGDLDQAVDFLLQTGPAARVLREAGAQVSSQVTGAIREALVPYVTPNGVQMGGAAWIVTARQPA